jgi:hypothetical protein
VPGSLPITGRIPAVAWSRFRADRFLGRAGSPSPASRVWCGAGQRSPIPRPWRSPADSRRSRQATRASDDIRAAGRRQTTPTHLERAQP